MSKLFEALSSLSASRRPSQAEASSSPVLPELVGAGTVATVAKQEAKAEQHALKVVSSTVATLVMPEPSLRQPADVSDEAVAKQAEAPQGEPLFLKASPDSRLVALTDPNSLGAEKFRALVTRFDHLRKKSDLKSFQVTSSVIHEGKTVVAGNVAVTFARYSHSKTLLVEGDLHRPALASIFGVNNTPGISHWWSSNEREFGSFVRPVNDLPLCFLSAGNPCDQPSDILRSERFRNAFLRLASQFEWIVVDSTPMLPIVDVNLWSRLVDGTLLVVREGVTPVKALERGLKALDHPKLIGIVVNDATEFDQLSYEGQYYGGSNRYKPSANNG